MINIDEPRALALLDTVVEGREDRVYQTRPDAYVSCVYEYAGKPDCLVGAALFEAGVPIEVLKVLNGCGTVESPRFSTQLIKADVYLTPSAREVFAVAQKSQDLKDPWGIAVAKAHQHVANTGRVYS